MENTSNADQIQLLQALQRDLAVALADLKKIKAKLGIDQPVSPGPGGPSGPQPPINPPGGPLVQ